MHEDGIWFTCSANEHHRDSVGGKTFRSNNDTRQRVCYISMKANIRTDTQSVVDAMLRDRDFYLGVLEHTTEHMCEENVHFVIEASLLENLTENQEIVKTVNEIWVTYFDPGENAVAMPMEQILVQKREREKEKKCGKLWESKMKNVQQNYFVFRSLVLRLRNHLQKLIQKQNCSQQR